MYNVQTTSLVLTIEATQIICCVHIAHLKDYTLQLCHMPITSLAPKTKMDTHDMKAIFGLYRCNLLLVVRWIWGMAQKMTALKTNVNENSALFISGIRKAKCISWGICDLTLGICLVRDGYKEVLCEVNHLLSKCTSLYQRCIAKCEPYVPNGAFTLQTQWHVPFTSTANTLRGGPGTGTSLYTASWMRTIRMSAKMTSVNAARVIFSNVLYGLYDDLFMCIDKAPFWCIDSVYFPYNKK